MWITELVGGGATPSLAYLLRMSNCESAGGAVQGAQGVERCDPGQEAQELGTALGHLLLYVQLVANILGAPLLYEVPNPPQALVPTHTTVRGRMIA